MSELRTRATLRRLIAVSPPPWRRLGGAIALGVAASGATIALLAGSGALVDKAADAAGARCDRRAPRRRRGHRRCPGAVALRRAPRRARRRVPGPGPLEGVALRPTGAAVAGAAPSVALGRPRPAGGGRCRRAPGPVPTRPEPARPGDRGRRPRHRRRGRARAGQRCRARNRALGRDGRCPGHRVVVATDRRRPGGGRTARGRRCRSRARRAGTRRARAGGRPPRADRTLRRAPWPGQRGGGRSGPGPWQRSWRCARRSR